MMGSEPYLRALDHGAEVVLGWPLERHGVSPASPVRAGIPAGIAWHAAEDPRVRCRSRWRQRTSPDCLMATCPGGSISMSNRLDPALRCTPQSIASHSLYEKCRSVLACGIDAARCDCELTRR